MKRVASAMILLLMPGCHSQNRIGQKRRVSRLNEAEVQYKQYCKVYARQHGIPLEEAKEHKVCKEYKKYCEEVFGCRISEKEGIY